MSFRADLLKGHVALVTGGGTGICRGIALAFAAHGCDVAIMSRKMEHLEPTLADLEATGPHPCPRAPAWASREPGARGTSRPLPDRGGLTARLNGPPGSFFGPSENWWRTGSGR